MIWPHTIFHFRQFFVKSEPCSKSTFKCKSGKCIPGIQKCDGIPQCKDGEDESLENCKSSFPPTATYGAPDHKCLKPNIYNMEIEIMAVPCNKIPECEGGGDEDGCDFPKYIWIIIVQ